MKKLQQHENWIDTVKVFACILVVLGHFFQSMVKSNILPETHFYEWFNRTIYYFHVPLFFLCSGYLFQKFAVVRSFYQWKTNFLKKFLSLCVPYLTFSLITYLMKILFSGSINNEAGGLLETLLLHPTSPYWYLYALICIFAITMTVQSRQEAVACLVVALVMKGLALLPMIKVQALGNVLENEIWFVAGMLISFFGLPAKAQNIKLRWGVLAGMAFVGVSVLLYCFTAWNAVAAFMMGIFGCGVTVLIVWQTCHVTAINQITSALAKYTFPVFLMHTIFAAGLRSVLLKLGIWNSILQIACGIAISFLGPVVAVVIISKVRWLEFLLYPNKFIQIGGRKK